LTMTHVLSGGEGLVVVLLVFGPFLAAMTMRRERLASLRLPRRWVGGLVEALNGEERDLEIAQRPQRGRPIDAAVAVVALVVVVVASVAMERGATSAGHHLHVANVIIGGVVRAAVTSLPNAVAAIYLARRGRSSASFSTAMSSNNLNVVAGLLLPSTFLGLAASSAVGEFVAVSALALTVGVLLVAFAQRGLTRRAGWFVVAGYVAFVIVTCLLA
jgi:Ca2+/Na+ antiporter